MRSMLTVLLFCGLFGVASRAIQPPEPLPTTEELRQLFKDQEYAGLLRKLNRVLQLRGEAARQYDAVELNLLKVDAHLQLKQLSLATAAASAAVKAIDEDRTPVREAAVAQATEAMIQRSRGWTYLPRVVPGGRPPQPLSIVDPEARPAVFAAMFEDAKGANVAKVRAGKQSRALGPIVDAVKAVSEMRTLELAASGKEEQSAAQLKDLADAAHDVMAAAVKDMAIRQNKINTSANEMLPVGSVPTGVTGLNNQPIDAVAVYRKRGLDLRSGRELRDMIATCEQVEAVARQFALLSRTAAPDLKEVQDTAAKVGQAAKATLDDDYSGEFAN